MTASIGLQSMRIDGRWPVVAPIVSRLSKGRSRRMRADVRSPGGIAFHARFAMLGSEAPRERLDPPEDAMRKSPDYDNHFDPTDIEDFVSTLALDLAAEIEAGRMRSADALTLLRDARDAEERMMARAAKAKAAAIKTPARLKARDIDAGFWRSMGWDDGLPKPERVARAESLPALLHVAKLGSARPEEPIVASDSPYPPKKRGRGRPKKVA